MQVSKANNFFPINEQYFWWSICALNSMVFLLKILFQLQHNQTVMIPSKQPWLDVYTFNSTDECYLKKDQKVTQNVLTNDSTMEVL